MTEAQEAFEADLEAAMRLLDDPPAPGSAEDRRLAEILERIERYRPEGTEEAPPSPLDAKIDRLSERIRNLRERRESDREIGPTTDHGIGPTLGGDLGGR